MNGKMCLIVGCLLLNGLFACAQSHIEFGYDAAGNRIYRRVIVLDNGLRRASAEDDDVEEDFADMTQNEESERWKPSSEIDVRIYPNPTHGRLMVQVSGTVSSGEAVVYGMQGSLLLKENLSEGFNVLELSSFEQGRYVLVLMLNGEKREYVVVKK